MPRSGREGDPAKRRSGELTMRAAFAAMQGGLTHPTKESFGPATLLADPLFGGEAVARLRVFKTRYNSRC